MENTIQEKKLFTFDGTRTKYCEEASKLLRFVGVAHMEKKHAQQCCNPDDKDKILRQAELAVEYHFNTCPNCESEISNN